MDGLKIFKSNEFGSIRTIEDDGKILFCAKDVAIALGYKDTVNAVNLHCKSDGVVYHNLIDSLGRNQLAKFINEGNLYRLITHSKLSTAEKFERWVFDEVLPTIRKQGSYGQFDIEKVISMTISETVRQLMPLLKQNVISGYEDDDTVEEIVVKKRTRRKPAGIIEKLDPETRKIVDDMICSPRCTYKDIMEMLNECGIEITQASISRYAQRYF